jgi:hypothetical protein
MTAYFGFTLRDRGRLRDRRAAHSPRAFAWPRSQRRERGQTLMKIRFR